MRVGVIVRRGSRRREIELFSKFFDVQIYEVPEELPELIENPEDYLKLPADFRPDILISFANHPDINLELIRLAAEREVGLVIFSGRESGSYAQLKAEAKKLGVRIIWEEICCATPSVEGFEEFFDRFGSPEVEVEVEGGRIRDVRVKRSAFCGATYFVAEKLKGASVDEAPRLAGYYTQIFPCLAPRGIDGGIHRAARAHKRAVEKAIERAKS